MSVPDKDDICRACGHYRYLHSGPLTQCQVGHCRIQCIKFVEPETREETIKRLEASGDLDPACGGCREHYAAKDPARVFAPRHRASTRCESGKRHHCTCDTCF